MDMTEQEEAERYRDSAITHARAQARDEVKAARAALVRAERHVLRLGETGPDHLYDVEFVETDQRPVTVVNAFAQAHVALAAIEGCIPTEGT